MGSADAIFARDDVTGVSVKKDVSNHYQLEPHICRHCFGRLVSEPLVTAGGDGQSRAYTCSNCGATERGTSASVLCCCGITLNSAGGQAVDAGIRCHPNPKPTPDFPALIVASAGGSKR